ncbi:hypothetical protein DLK05_03295 [Ancylomarina longa]|uniref:Uncharacterized protein n=1 Tax=Ancylomarina longa TaxID=2487017 RepID=A0A434AXI1_9BACT|nr:hypothetical protein DLK05_03295 [Ancylomarina longa]
MYQFGKEGVFLQLPNGKTASRVFQPIRNDKKIAGMTSFALVDCLPEWANLRPILQVLFPFGQLSAQMGKIPPNSAEAISIWLIIRRNRRDSAQFSSWHFCLVNCPPEREILRHKRQLAFPFWQLRTRLGKAPPL